MMLWVLYTVIYIYKIFLPSMTCALIHVPVSVCVDSCMYVAVYLCCVHVQSCVCVCVCVSVCVCVCLRVCVLHISRKALLGP